MRAHFERRPEKTPCVDVEAESGHITGHTHRHTHTRRHRHKGLATLQREQSLPEGVAVPPAHALCTNADL